MDETDTVILAEGIFDVIALTRRLELYDNSHVAAVATFGRKYPMYRSTSCNRKASEP